MAAKPRSIYVQIDIDASLQRVWDLTQSPDLHRRWDLRFTDIQYLPRPELTQPQRFSYATRIGLGFCIHGAGETVGVHDGPAGERTSSLKFWSDDSKSLIRKGSGFWKYIPRNDSKQSVRFLTRYDYEVRFGAAGRLFDQIFFRPLLGWATAWSFDRLRLWVEKGVEPAISARLSIIYLICRTALSFVWIYQGLVPKLIFRHPAELAMLHDVGFSDAAARAACLTAGAAEIGIGLLLLLVWKSRLLVWITLGLMPVAALVVALMSPRMLIAAFNPITLNVAVFALAAVTLCSGVDLPSARRCSRRAAAGEGD